MEVLESHYFHIPYPGALGLLRECGQAGAGQALGCGGNLRPCARLQGETGLDSTTLGSGVAGRLAREGWVGGWRVPLLSGGCMAQTNTVVTLLGSVSFWIDHVA